MASSALVRLAAADGYGTSPLKYRVIIDSVRLARLPSPFARSLLKRCTSASKENDPSEPNTISRIRKYRSASAPSVSRIVWLRTMLPRDFDILFSSKSSHPCATIDFGRGSPAANRNAGQDTQ